MTPIIRDNENLREDGFRIIPGMINVGFWARYEDLCRNNQWLAWPNAEAEAKLEERFMELYKRPLMRYTGLYKKGRERGVNFVNLDMVDDFGKIDCFLFSDLPRMKSALVKKAFAAKKPRFLLLEECAAIYPKNWNLDGHKHFEKIFTWHDDFIDGKKYFKINIYFIDVKKIDKDLSRKEKLCVAIIGNKASMHPLELFSKRREAVNWFERRHPEDFDLYGFDWDLCTFFMDKRVLSRLARGRLRFLSRLLAQKHASWKGRIKEKKPVLEKYRFAISYENARDIPGYIADKMFDCFSAGTVPVYWGASNVTDHIPGNCFIDKRNFDSYEKLYDFMKSINDRQYLEYLSHIENFLNSEKAYQFSSEYFANTIIGEIKKTVEARR